MIDCRQSEVTVDDRERPSKIVGDHRRSEATYGSRGRLMAMVDGRPRSLYIGVNVRQGFWRWSPLSTIVGKLAEKWREMRLFGDDQFLYKRNSISHQVNLVQ